MTQLDCGSSHPIARVTLWVTGIDEALARQPETKGAEVSEGLRYLQFGGLRAYYVVSQDERLVEVVGIKPAR